MRIGIMQPYFFPYLGYFSLIRQTDKWVLLDEVQYIRHGWIERNRILKPGEGWQYISVPLVKASRDTLIKDIRIRTNEPWTKRIFSQLEHYKKRAPNYQQVTELLHNCFALETDSIVQLNNHILKIICGYLDIRYEGMVFSEMGLNISEVQHAGQWALNITEAMGGSEYINPIGGVEIFKEEEFINKNIKLSFLQNELKEYSQRRGVFEPGLSIIDVLMFNSKDETIRLIDAISFIPLAKV